MIPSPGAWLRRRARGLRRAYLAVALCTLGNAGALAGQYWLLSGIIADAVRAGTLPLPRLAAVLALVLARVALAWGAEDAAIAAAARLRLALRGELAERLFAAGPVALAARPAGALVAVLTDAVDALDPYFARAVPAMIAAALLPPAVLLAAAAADWRSALILALTAPLIPLAMVLVGRGAEQLNRAHWARLARLAAHLHEALGGLTVLRLFGAAGREAQAVGRSAEAYRQATMGVLRVAFLSALALEFFATAGIALVAVTVGFRLLWGTLDLRTGSFLLLLAPEFYLPLRALGGAHHARMEAEAAAEAIAALPDAPPRPEVAATPAPAPELVLRDVAAVYPDGRQGLRGLSATFPAGRITALSGPSGSGKSTVLNLLLGFLPPASGAVLANGAPVGPAWRARFAYVPQRPHLFRGSVAGNIALACPGAPMERVAEAAALVGLTGLEREIAEGGGGLSGGQVRLVALARAVLAEAPVLLLDEPTASLDPAAEAEVVAAIRRIAPGRTVVLATHRPATLALADAVVAL